MRRLAEGLNSLAITLWAGGLWAIGFIAAPSLFASLKDRALAGELAGNLFGLVAWMGFACAAWLLGFLAVRRGRSVFRSGLFWLVAAMFALGLVGHFGIQPVLAELKAEVWPRSVMDSPLRDRFAVWHGLAGGLYVLQCLLGAALVLLQGRMR